MYLFCCIDSKTLNSFKIHVYDKITIYLFFPHWWAEQNSPVGQIWLTGHQLNSPEIWHHVLQQTKLYESHQVVLVLITVNFLFDFYFYFLPERLFNLYPASKYVDKNVWDARVCLWRLKGMLVNNCFLSQHAFWKCTFTSLKLLVIYSVCEHVGAEAAAEEGKEFEVM